MRPYVAFGDHLPGLLGGEAFPGFRNPSAVAIDFSIPGLVFKLKLLGLGSLSFGASRIVGWLYTVVVAVVVIVISRRPCADDDEPALWLAILTLATLRSPFLPQAYAAFPPLWLVTLLAARQPPTAKTLLFTMAAWLALNLYWPLDPAGFQRHVQFETYAPPDDLAPFVEHFWVLRWERIRGTYVSEEVMHRPYVDVFVALTASDARTSFVSSCRS